MSTATEHPDVAAALRGRHFLTLDDYSADEIRYLIDLSAELKAAKREGREEQQLVGREIALIFEKDSTRTRCAFEVAAYDQGAHVTFIGPSGSHMGHKETVKDTARVLGRMYDAIEYRGFGEAIADELARVGGRAGLQRPDRRVAPDADARRLPHDARAPAQAARGDDVLLPRRRPLQHGQQLPGRRREAGHGRADRRPASRCGRRRSWSTMAREFAEASGGRITITEDVEEAVRGCDFLLTDVWVSMGEPDDVWAERIELLMPYQINAQTMAADRQPGRQVHALPAGVPQRRHAGRQGDRREVRHARRWRSPRRSSSRPRRSSSTRPRTACTRSRRSWSPRSGADRARRRRPRRQRAAAPRPGAVGGEPARERARGVRGARADRARARAGHRRTATGPQVGLLALQGSAYTAVDTYPLDVLGAQTEGMIGYMLEQELGNELPFERHLATLLTMIEVDRGRPGVRAPDEADRPALRRGGRRSPGAREGLDVHGRRRQHAPRRRRRRRRSGSSAST